MPNDAKRAYYRYMEFVKHIAAFSIPAETMAILKDMPKVVQKVWRKVLQKQK